MKTSVIMLAGLMLAVICIFGLLAGAGDVPAIPKADTEPASSEQSGENEQPTVFVLKLWNGQLAVFAGTGDTPAITYDVLEENLPELDVLLLTRGITAQSYAELRSLIEDYTS